MLPGVRLLCWLLPLLPRGHGDAEYGDLKDEGQYVYLDEDGPLEVLGGPARCQDTYQDWISLYCWAPFHATLMATPESSRCLWDQISSTYSELSSCTQWLAQLLSCPWPSTVLDTFFLQVHAEYFTNCTGTGPPQLARLPPLPPGLAVAAAVGLSCLVPLAAALTLRRAWKGARNPAGSCPAPACPHPCERLAAAPFLPSPGNYEWDEWAEGEGDRGQSRDGSLGIPGDGVGPMAVGEAGTGALDACICRRAEEQVLGEGSQVLGS